MVLSLKEMEALVFDFDYNPDNAEYPSWDLPLAGSMVVPNMINPLPKELVIFKSKYVYMVRLKASLIQQYRYVITPDGKYIPFSAYVESGTLSLREGSYYHLYAQFGHDRIDKHWTGGIGRFDDTGDTDLFWEAREKNLLSILGKVIKGEF